MNELTLVQLAYEGPALNDGRDRYKVVRATPLKTPIGKTEPETTHWTIAYRSQARYTGLPGDGHPKFPTREDALAAWNKNTSTDNR